MSILRIFDEAFDKSFLAGIAGGVEKYEKLKAMQEAGEQLEQAMQFIFSAGVAAQVEQKLSALMPQVEKHLQWTGHAGAVIEVLMMQDKSLATPPELAGVRFLGSGARPIDVLILYTKNAQMNAASLPAAYRWAPEASLMYWVKRGTNGYDIYVVAPGSLGALYTQAAASVALQASLRAQSGTRELEALSSIVDQIQRERVSDAIKATVRDALAERKRIEGRQQEIDKELAEKLKQSAKIDGARAWLEVLGNALNLADTIMHVKAMLGPAVPKELQDDIERARDKTALASKIVEYETRVTTRKEALIGEQRVVSEQIRTSRTTIYEAAKNNGAPETVLNLP